MEHEMKPMVLEVSEKPRLASVDRLSFSGLVKLGLEGRDVESVWSELVERLPEEPRWTGMGLDLSLLAQMRGNRHAGLAIQREVLARHQLFRVLRVSEPPRLRVLALAAAIDAGGNAPIEFLLEGADIELMVLYVVPGVELPNPLPDHDVAIVIASGCADCREALHKIDTVVPCWPRPLLNRPKFVADLDRNGLHEMLGGIEGLAVPSTIVWNRVQLLKLVESSESLPDLGAHQTFPIIVRPCGSHGGAGFAKIDDCAALKLYLDEREEEDYFVSQFIDYSSEDGLFRKYRIVFVEGVAFACHMTIADRCDIWYRNADMSNSPAKRAEDENFVRTFDHGFGGRHHQALQGLASRLGLDYFVVECAETTSGALLLFEADNAAVVHDLDPPHIFPYRSPQIRRIFRAFVDMLDRRRPGGKQLAA
jgi:hypothetical protein